MAAHLYSEKYERNETEKLENISMQLFREAVGLYNAAEELSIPSQSVESPPESYFVRSGGEMAV